MNRFPIALTMMFAVIVIAQVGVACPRFTNNGSVQFYSSPGSDASGDFSFRAGLQDVVVAELDFEQYAQAELVPWLSTGNTVVDVTLLNDDGTDAPTNASAFYSSNVFHFPETVHQTTLLNGTTVVGGGAQNINRPRMELEFSTPVRGFGTWIFDDHSCCNHQFVMHVVLADGQTSTSPILDEGSAGWQVEGFLGVVSAIGIRSVVVEEQELDGTLATDTFFELDHVQIGPASGNYCSATPNSTGASAFISAMGSSNLTQNDLTLAAGPVPDQFFLFFYGPEQQAIPFGNGLLCIAGGVTRINPPDVATANVATRSVDLPSAGLTAPGSLNFQCWFRDPGAGGLLFDLSDGLSITFLP